MRFLRRTWRATVTRGGSSPPNVTNAQTHEALAFAAAHRVEVFEAVCAAADLDAAVHQVAELLGVNSDQAMIVLDTPLRRFTRRDRAVMAEAYDEAPDEP